MWTDGASKGNPGRSGGGVYIISHEKQKVIKGSFFYGKNTNNVAEWRAFVDGLKICVEKGISHVECFLDSKLVVEQFNGRWKLRKQHLRQYFDEANVLKTKFSGLTVKWIFRSENVIADSLANTAVAIGADRIDEEELTKENQSVDRVPVLSDFGFQFQDHGPESWADACCNSDI